MFNDSLNFSVHIYETINKCISILALLQRNFKDLTKESFLLLYKLLVRSKLEYAGNVWSPWKIKEIESIERVQKRATKMVKECVGLKYEERLKVLNLPCLRYRRTRGDLIMVFNMLRNHEDCHCYPDLKRHQDDRTRGHNYKLDKIRFCKNMRKFYFSNRVVTS